MGMSLLGFFNGDTLDNLPKVNRVEVVDGNGRSYMNYKASEVSISFQDDGRTLKIFLK